MKRRAGRLLLVGGHKHEFSQLQGIYEAAETAGIGECQAVVPDTLRKLIGETGYIRFAPASASGSLGKAALGEIMHLAGDFDGIVIGANLTNNAETAVMVESLITKLDMPVIITEEAIEILKFNPQLITGNSQVLVVTTMPGLFALANYHHMPIAIKPGSGVVGKVEILRQLMDISKCAFFIFDREIFVGAESDISVTSLNNSLSDLPGAAIGAAGVWWLQNQAKPFASLTAAAYLLQEATKEAVSGYGPLGIQLRQAINRYDF